MSDKQHFIWLTPVFNETGEFHDEYYINTHAYEDRGLAAYPKGGNVVAEIYQKDSEGAQNDESKWKFEKHCDGEKFESCLTWRIMAVEAHSEKLLYIHSKTDDDFIYLDEFARNDPEAFLWTLEYY